MAAIEISGCGVITPLGLGINTFKQSLMNGDSNFTVSEFHYQDKTYSFPSAMIEEFDLKKEIDGLDLPDDISKRAKRFRNVSQGTSYALLCALEAWKSAGLFNADIPADRIAIICGGSNTQQKDSQDLRDKYAEKLNFMNPNYAINLFDTDVNGVISELLNIKGEGFSVGSASASSNMALIQAKRLLSGGYYDVILVIAPMMNLSIYEFQSFTNLGAMAALKEDGFKPSELCRPFDISPQGFVYGQNTGCMILETSESALKRGKQNHIAISGEGVSMDANRNPNPSEEGECRAMKNALKAAEVQPEEINYINAHGTASPLGDKTEVAAILQAGIKNATINSTKSVIGHGLTSAGLVETIATAIQMENGFIHASENIETPVTEELNFAVKKLEQQELKYALSNGFGFGGINTSILLENLSLTRK